MVSYNAPNFKRAEYEAYATLLEVGANSLPINLKKIIAHYPDLSLITYSRLAESEAMSVEEIGRLLSSHEGCLHYEEDGKYILYFNDTLANKNRIRFTIAHELGHYVMGHLKNNSRANISRYSLTIEENRLYEKEADHFAGKLLAPIPLVGYFIGKFGELTPNSLTSFFNVSYQAANIVLKEISRVFRYGFNPSYRKDLQEQFALSLEQKVNQSYCKNCKSISILPHATSCPICGHNELVFINNHNHLLFDPTFRGDLMKYNKIEVDENSKAITCPNCENEDLPLSDGDHCGICGIYVKNICSGFRYENSMPAEPHEPSQLHGCGNNHLEGNHRFCPDCGMMSTFYYYGILRNWIDEYEKVK